MEQKRQPGDGRVYDLREENSKKSPGHGGTQADIPVQIKALVAVIPVFHFEQPFHGPARDVFQHRGGDHSGNVHQEHVVFQWQRHPQHHNGPGAVKGQHGKPQETAVHKPARLARHVGGFENPAEKAISVKDQQPLVPGVSVHIDSSFTQSIENAVIIILCFGKKSNV